MREEDLVILDVTQLLSPGAPFMKCWSYFISNACLGFKYPAVNLLGDSL